jgi:hypothetical protein
MTHFELNGKAVDVDATPDTPVLWVLRDHLGLTGTKFGCGKTLCRACTVHLDGEATFSCLLPLSAVEGRKVTTIEGLGGACRRGRAERVGQRPGAAVRLLSAGPGDGGRRAPHSQSAADRHRAGDAVQPVPLWDVPAHPHRDP